MLRFVTLCIVSIIIVVIIIIIIEECYYSIMSKNFKNAVQSQKNTERKQVWYGTDLCAFSWN